MEASYYDFLVGNHTNFTVNVIKNLTIRMLGTRIDI